MQNPLTKTLLRQVARSTREMTILFTDIEDSTFHWSDRGDLQGRLLLDKHNRLAFPVVRQFRGRIIKTIGDSIMAAFRRPEDAVHAAVCLQQLFAQERQQDPAFNLRIRIGIHTGKALAEHNDVYGDAVNMASRVESRAKGNQILVSEDTASRLSGEHPQLGQFTRFQPKGKSSPVTVYQCGWQKWEDLTQTYRPDRLPLASRQRIELLGFITAGLAALYFIYQEYLRYFLADSPEVALFYLSPLRGLLLHPWILIAAVALVLVALVLLFRIRSLPHVMLRLTKGGFGFALGFALAWLAVTNFQPPGNLPWNEVLYESEHLFVEVAADSAPVHRKPDPGSKVVRRLDSGDLLLLADFRRRAESTWNKVLIDVGSYGWIERVSPPRIGQPSRRLTWTDKFYFRQRDLIPFEIALLGFLWGFLNFRLRPL